MKEIRYLMDSLEEFQKSDRDREFSPAAFSLWLYEKEHSEDKLQTWFREISVPGETPDSVIAKYVIFLYRYAKYYGKKVFRDLPLNSLDDWPFLMSLLVLPGQTKKSLIESNLMEKPSGMEIINRLIREGLIIQDADPADRRGKILQITELGKEVLFKTSIELDLLSKIVGGKLTPLAKLRLLKSLHELHLFHLPVFSASRDMDLKQIARTFLYDQK